MVDKYMRLGSYLALWSAAIMSVQCYSNYVFAASRHILIFLGTNPPRTLLIVTKLRSMLNSFSCPMVCMYLDGTFGKALLTSPAFLNPLLIFMKNCWANAGPFSTGVRWLPPTR